MDENTKLIGVGVTGALLSMLCLPNPVAGYPAWRSRLDRLRCKTRLRARPRVRGILALVAFALVRRRRSCAAKTPEPG
jgi:hypothetical protein